MRSQVSARSFALRSISPRTNNLLSTRLSSIFPSLRYDLEIPIIHEMLAHPVRTLLLSTWCGRNRNCRFKLDLSIVSKSTISMSWKPVSTRFLSNSHPAREDGFHFAWATTTLNPHVTSREQGCVFPRRRPHISSAARSKSSLRTSNIAPLTRGTCLPQFRSRIGMKMVRHQHHTMRQSSTFYDIYFTYYILESIERLVFNVDRLEASLGGTVNHRSKMPPSTVPTCFQLNCPYEASRTA